MEVQDQGHNLAARQHEGQHLPNLNLTEQNCSEQLLLIEVYYITGTIFSGTSVTSD